MTNKNKIVMIFSIATPFIILGAIIWLGLRNISPQPHLLTTQPSPSTSQGSSLRVSSGSDNPLGGGLDSSINQSVVNGPTTENSTQRAPNNSSSNPSRQAATIDPTQFGQYEKYKDDQSALFADIKIGTGAEASSGKKLAVNYQGWLTNGTMFDQNVNPDKPFIFTLGAGSVIAGWEQTVGGMKVGGQRLLIIPPSVGYGSTAQKTIPANSVLIFEVSLQAVE